MIDFLNETRWFYQELKSWMLSTQSGLTSKIQSTGKLTLNYQRPVNWLGYYFSSRNEIFPFSNNIASFYWLSDLLKKLECVLSGTHVASFCEANLISNSLLSVAMETIEGLPTSYYIIYSLFQRKLTYFAWAYLLLDWFGFNPTSKSVVT